MGFKQFFVRRRAAIISTITITALVGTLAAAALRSPGFEQPSISVNDGGVWVSNNGQGKIGRLNVPAQSIDGTVGVGAGKPNIDVLQSGTNVLALAQDEVSVVDTATLSQSSPVKLPTGAKPALFNGLLTFADDTGAMWVLPPAQVAAFNPKTTPKAAQLGAAATIAMSLGGATGFAYIPKTNTLITLTATKPAPASSAATTKAVTPTFAVTDTTKLIDFTGGNEVQLTVVGDRAVLFNPTTSSMWVDGTTQTIAVTGYKTSSGDKLQTPGPIADTVKIASSAGLVDLKLDGSPGTLTAVGTNGVPAAPMYFQGCTYGAWGGSNMTLRQCGDRKATISAVPYADSDSQFVFRSNNGFIVLNSLTNGKAWLVSRNLELVNNWTPNNLSNSKLTKESDETSQEIIITPDQTKIDRTAENHPPKPKDDAFGVRPGGTLLLPVTANDTDEDGDILTVTGPKSLPGGTIISTALNSTAFVAKVPDDAPLGNLSFKYTVADGRGGTATANVVLTILGDNIQNPPKLKNDKMNPLRVAATGSATTNVLNDWIDPEGDAIFLTDARLENENAKDGSVQFTADGDVTYTDSGVNPTQKLIKVTVSDDKGLTATSQLRVQVLAEDKVEPITSPDHVQVLQGRQATVEPLRNDYDPRGGQLTLTSADATPTGLVVTPSFAAGTFTVSSNQPGTYYVLYGVVDSNQKATKNVVRVDVLAKGTGDLPVAVDDIAVLPTNGTNLVNAIDNDTDPLGGVLVLTEVSDYDESLFRVEILQHAILRITSLAPFATPKKFTYKVANAAGASTGTVLVTPVQAATQPKPPIALPDYARVRSGDVVSVRVLDNDSDPQSGTLTLDPTLSQAPDAKLGSAFVSGKEVRFLATAATGTATLQYKVSNGVNAQTAKVTIEIVPRAKTNQPPTPQIARARTVSGQKVRIPIVLSNIDPDGDTTFLMSVGTPGLGKISGQGPDWVEYTPLAGVVGSDTFTYTVRDNFGAEASSTIYVGVVKPAEAIKAPIAVADMVTVRPGKRISVPVLANDSDPQGMQLTIDKEQLKYMPAELKPEVVNEQLVLDLAAVKIPPADKEKVYKFNYRVTNGTLASSAEVKLVIANEAPAKPPVPQDDRIAPEAIDGKTELTVNVLSNDSDPMGTASDLLVSLVTKTKFAVVNADQTVNVAPQAEAQVIQYRVTNPTLKTTGEAFIFVPAKPKPKPPIDMTPPKLIEGKTLTVKAGTTVQVALKEFVKTRTGRTPKVFDESTVTAVNNNGASGSQLVQSPEILKFTADLTQSGPGLLKFQVSDGNNAQDAGGVKAEVAIPVTVLPADRVAPSFQAAGLEVEQANPTGSTIDLAPLTQSNNPQAQLAWKFDPSKAPAGFTVSLQGATLKAVATTAKEGATASVPIIISDGAGPTTKTVSIPLKVTASKRPLLTLENAALPNARPGQPATVNVLTGATNPFAAEQKPLSIVGQPVVDAAKGSATLSSDGTLKVTPAAGFIGEFQVTYKVGDATGSASRYVTGTTNVTVKSVPAAATGVRITGSGNKYLDVSWTAPAANGESISSYTVTPTTAGTPGKATECTSTACRIEGLQNGATYTVTVVAKNIIGAGPASAKSGPGTPDTKPERPEPPTVAFGDKSLKVTWVAPQNEGSPIVSYDVTIAPAPLSGAATQNIKAGSLTTTFANLQNGTQYSVSVRARNSAKDPSDYSLSKAEVPSGLAIVTAAPKVTRFQQTTGGRFDLVWSPANNNGAAITEYRITVTSPSGARVPAPIVVPNGGTSQVITELDPNGEYVFAISAKNRSGWSQPGPGSQPQVAYSVPSAVTAVTGVQINPGAVTARDASYTVSWPAANGNGTAITGYVVTWAGGSITAGANQTSVVAQGGILTGTKVKFTVRPKNKFVEGAETSSATYNPVGQPGQTITIGNADTQGQVSFQWFLGRGNPELNGGTFAGYELSVVDEAGNIVVNNGVRVGDPVRYLGTDPNYVTREGTTGQATYQTTAVGYGKRVTARVAVLTRSIDDPNLILVGAPKGLNLTTQPATQQITANLEWSKDVTPISGQSLPATYGADEVFTGDGRVVYFTWANMPTNATVQLYVTEPGAADAVSHCSFRAGNYSANATAVPCLEYNGKPYALPANRNLYVSLVVIDDWGKYYQGARASTLSAGNEPIWQPMPMR